MSPPVIRCQDGLPECVQQQADHWVSWRDGFRAEGFSDLGQGSERHRGAGEHAGEIAVAFPLRTGQQAHDAGEPFRDLTSRRRAGGLRSLQAHLAQHLPDGGNHLRAALAQIQQVFVGGGRNFLCRGEAAAEQQVVEAHRAGGRQQRAGQQV